MGKRKEEKPLTEQQKKAVAMLYAGEKVCDTAKTLGVHRATVWRWECMRGFQREWNRIDRNLRRRNARREEKRIAEESAYWDQKLREAEQKLQEESAKITEKPDKEWYKAWNEYEKAACRGMTLAQLFDAMNSGGGKRRNRRRH